MMMGCTLALLSTLGLLKASWLLTETRKGTWLCKKYGDERAGWILRILLTIGVVFGGLLATNIIRPMQW